MRVYETRCWQEEIAGFMHLPRAAGTAYEGCSPGALWLPLGSEKCRINFEAFPEIRIYMKVSFNIGSFTEIHA